MHVMSLPMIMEWAKARSQTAGATSYNLVYCAYRARSAATCVPRTSALCASRTRCTTSSRISREHRRTATSASVPAMATTSAPAERLTSDKKLWPHPYLLPLRLLSLSTLYINIYYWHQMHRIILLQKFLIGELYS